MPSRRNYLKMAGSIAGLVTTAGCTITKGSTDPSMDAVMGVEGLAMFKGAPARGEYPAEPSHVEMEMPGGMHMEMDAVTVKTTAADDDSDNYHFMPHVTWVEPGQMMFWEHFARAGVSEKRTHTATSFGAAGRFPRLIPDGGVPFDSAYRAGTHGAGKLINEQANRDMVRLIGQEGGFSVTFEQEGVYLFYCQNHHMFKMAGAAVVGELWGENGDKALDNPQGWAPAMTTDLDEIKAADPFHGEALADQVRELREMIKSGGEMMGHGMEMGGDGHEEDGHGGGNGHEDGHEDEGHEG